jgi:hypothetical protein
MVQNPPFTTPNPHMTSHQFNKSAKMKMSSPTPNQNEKYPNERKTHTDQSDPRKKDPARPDPNSNLL